MRSRTRPSRSRSGRRICSGAGRVRRSLSRWLRRWLSSSACRACRTLSSMASGSLTRSLAVLVNRAGDQRDRWLALASMCGNPCRGGRWRATRSSLPGASRSMVAPSSRPPLSAHSVVYRPRLIPRLLQERELPRYSPGRLSHGRVRRKHVRQGLGNGVRRRAKRACPARGASTAECECCAPITRLSPQSIPHPL